MGEKAETRDFIGRFREIISDPLNLLIERDPRAGFVVDDHVFLHNGLRVPIEGPHTYYGQFSVILAINRGVHEPLEEFVFQTLLARLPDAPVMLELGAYWGHYSMWLKLKRPNAVVHLVEPEPQNIDAGKRNFALNGFTGEFIQALVGKDQFGVDRYLRERGIQKLDVLHCDIQGNELEMLADSVNALKTRRIDYVVVSTHSQDLHFAVHRKLSKFGYRVEVTSDFDLGTTSYDGLVFASSPSVEPLFERLVPLNRSQIENATAAFRLEYLNRIARDGLYKRPSTTEEAENAERERRAS